MSRRALSSAAAAAALLLLVVVILVRADGPPDERSAAGAAAGRTELVPGGTRPDGSPPVARGDLRRTERAGVGRSRSAPPRRTAPEPAVPTEPGSAAPDTQPDQSDRPESATRACFTGRGIPQCGPVLGSAYGSNTDPASFESSIGHKLGIRRTYWTASQVDSAVRTAAADLNHGRVPWISFKLPHSWEEMASGSGDAWARNLSTKLADLPGPVWIAFHHEPEGDGDITAWTRMQARLAPIVRSTAPNVAYTIVLTGWHQLYGDTQYRLANMWPKNTKIDIAGFDVYNSLGVVKDGVMNTKGTDLATAYFKPISAWARSTGVAWGLAETGYTDYASERLPHWIQQTTAAMKTYGGVAFTYFNTTLNSIAPWTLGTPTKMADYAAAQAQSARWTR